MLLGINIKMRRTTDKQKNRAFLLTATSGVYASQCCYEQVIALRKERFMLDVLAWAATYYNSKTYDGVFLMLHLGTKMATVSERRMFPEGVINGYWPIVIEFEKLPGEYALMQYSIELCVESRMYLSLL